MKIISGQKLAHENRWSQFKKTTQKNSVLRGIHGRLKLLSIVGLLEGPTIEAVKFQFLAL